MATLRVRISERGMQKVNIAIPLGVARAGYLKTGTLVCEQLAKFGIDLEQVVRRAGQAGQLIDIAQGDDRVEIFVD